jgi:threonine dehydrogenase-like Zn-dependent dehydrogenase
MQLMFCGDRRFELVEAPAVALLDGEVELAVIAAGICGSDVHGYAGANNRRPAGTVMGHETVGRVEAVGRDAAARVGEIAAVWPIVACGDCDLCCLGQPHLCGRRQLYGCTPELPGGFATRMVVSSANLVPLPGDVPPELGALVEPLAVGAHAVEIAGATLGEHAIVIGGGPIGAATALAVRRRGAAVTVVEQVEARRVALEAIGLDTIGPGEKAPRDVETVFECVGLTVTLRAALDAVRPGGTVVCVGVAEPEVTIPIESLVIQERRLLGSSAYTRADFEAVTAALRDNASTFARMVEVRTDLASTPAAFEAYASGATTALKTLVFPNGDHLGR